MSTFSELGLSPALVATLSAMDFTTPTPIQAQAIPILLTGTSDMISLAQTGTGKTAAFGLPLVDILASTHDALEASSKAKILPLALILSPTRELCVQITNDLKKFSAHRRELRITSVYGGASIVKQIQDIRAGVHIVVATPGRLTDLLERKAIDLSSIRYVILDEADEMLNMGFKDDLDKILSHTPDGKNVWLFSATMPSEIQRIARTYMKDPQEVAVNREHKSNENIAHQYMVVDERNRYSALKRVLDFTPDVFGVVFCRTKADTQNIADMLMKDGYNADALHGDLTQAQRDKVMKSFRNKTLQLLVATDVAARGIDVHNVTHVIHLNMPDEIEYYTHRSGRTARAGKTGISLAIITTREFSRIRQVERMLGVTFEKQLVPTGKQICEHRLLELMHRLREVTIEEEEIATFLPAVYEELLPLDKEEIIKRFASLEFNRYLDYYRDAPDLNKSAQRDRTERGERIGYADSDSGFEADTALFISVGKMDGLDDKAKILSFICERCKITKAQLGKIRLSGAFTVVEVSHHTAETIKSKLHGFDFKGRRIRVEHDETWSKKGGGNPNRARGERSGSDRSGGRSYGTRNYGKSSSYSDSRREFGTRSSGSRDIGSRDTGSRDESRDGSSYRNSSRPSSSKEYGADSSSSPFRKRRKLV